MRSYDFLKFHAAGDEIVFLNGEQISKHDELEISLSILQPPQIRGTEVGILYPPEGSGDLKIKIVDNTTKGYISMCGGLTQALGKAVVENGLEGFFNIEITEPETDFVLETDSGLIPIKVKIDDGKAKSVTTNMDSYLERSYQLGIEEIQLSNDIEAMCVGLGPNNLDFLVFNVADLAIEFPNVNFWSKNEEALNALSNLYQETKERLELEQTYMYGGLYELQPETISDVRSVFRFFPTMGQNDSEFGCGTGTVAIAAAMQERGEIAKVNNESKLLFEVGSPSLSEGEQFTTELRLTIENEKPSSVVFSHNLVEPLAAGKVYV